MYIFASVLLLLLYFSCACCTTLKWFNRVYQTHAEHIVWSQCVNGFPFWKTCACFKVFIAKSCRFLCGGPNSIWNEKKKQEARKIAIITEHTQFFYSYFFSSFLFKTKQNKNQHRNFVDQTPSFVYLHSWHWVALVVVVVAVAIIVAAVARPTQQDAYTQTHIVGVSLMATN